MYSNKIIIYIGGEDTQKYKLNERKIKNFFFVISPSPPHTHTIEYGKKAREEKEEIHVVVTAGYITTFPSSLHPRILIEYIDICTKLRSF